jgi:FAD/FMN-containing dehydrogenase
VSGGSDPTADFAAEVGATDPVTVVGGRTAWEVGGLPAADAREVRAPRGVIEHVPAEMIVRVRAGTPVAELNDALARRGQMVPLDPRFPGTATVGGVLAVGHSGPRRLRFGPVRDWMLEARYVSATGVVVKAGAPVVKNVSGFDLVRLLVGSLGTLGLLAEVVLRTYPLAPVTVWLSAPGDPFTARDRLFRPSSVLWDGARTWVLLEGHPQDVAAERDALGPGWAEVGGPPLPPGGGRRSVRPDALPSLAGRLAPETFLAEVGVGVVHGLPTDVGASTPGPVVLDLNRRVKERFDPTGRLNPGRRVA